MPEIETKKQRCDPDSVEHLQPALKLHVRGTGSCDHLLRQPFERPYVKFVCVQVGHLFSSPRAHMESEGQSSWLFFLPDNAFSPCPTKHPPPGIKVSPTSRNIYITVYCMTIRTNIAAWCSIVYTPDIHQEYSASRRRNGCIHKHTRFRIWPS